MKKLFIIICAMSFFNIISAQQTRELGFGCYFGGEPRYTNKDWDKIEQQFDDNLTNYNWSSFDHKELSILLNLCTKIAKLDWEDEDISKIENYLNDILVKVMLNFKGKTYQIYNSNDSLRTFFSMGYAKVETYIFRAIQESGGTIECKSLREAIQIDQSMYSRFTKNLIGLAYQLYYSDTTLCDCLKSLVKENIINEETQIAEIQKISHRNTIANLSQPAALDYISKQLKKEKQFNFPINSKQLWQWNRDLGVIVEVYNNIDLSLMFNKYKEADSFGEQYLWLYYASLSTNNKLSRKMTVTDSDLALLYELLDTFLAANAENLSNPLIIEDKGTLKSLYANIKAKFK